ncbi:TPA: hypothetical protein N0F65_008199 [Lagenidium giganteum]|uniref:FYVE-type domain-containing protein n=1 Tax=Lagenidium giganteum TaxID=4803 RepID=A0AAV2YXR8_9STRA|nr:TPA: hypothetical protein N0F65_008199 [Lagenidium giganteum]
MKFLDASAIPAIEPSGDELSEYDRACDQLLATTLALKARGSGWMHDKQWQLMRQRDWLRVYHRVDNKKQAAPQSRLTGSFVGHLEDVMDGLYAETTHDLRIVRSILNPRFLDGGVLHVSRRRSDNAPFDFAGIRWYATRTNGSGICADRDMLTYERMGSAVDEEGDPIIRSIGSICFIYKQSKTEENVIDVFANGELDIQGHVPQVLADYAVCGKYLGIGNTVTCSFAKRFQKLLDQSQADSFKSSQHSSSCFLCWTPTKLLQRNRRCGACKKSVCKKCRIKHQTFALDPKTQQVIKETFCVECLKRAAKTGVKSGATSDNQASHDVEQAHVARSQSSSSRTSAPMSRMRDSEKALISAKIDSLLAPAVVDTTPQVSAVAKFVQMSSKVFDKKSSNTSTMFSSFSTQSDSLGQDADCPTPSSPTGNQWSKNNGESDSLDEGEQNSNAYRASLYYDAPM